MTTTGPDNDTPTLAAPTLYAPYPHPQAYSESPPTASFAPVAYPPTGESTLLAPTVPPARRRQGTPPPADPALPAGPASNRRAVLIAAAMVVAGGAVAALIVGTHASSPPPRTAHATLVPAPAPPPPHTTAAPSSSWAYDPVRVGQLVDRLTSHGVYVDHNRLPTVNKMANQICAIQSADGRDAAIRSVLEDSNLRHADNPGAALTPAQSRIVVDDSVAVYCPQYARG